METTLYLLKRSNGFYGIYKNGKTQDELISNSPLTNRVDVLINRILLEKGDANDVKVIITDNESEFYCGLPKLSEFIQMQS